jgi:SAM-dependent methyltransferase
VRLTDTLAADRWDAEYRRGRYVAEPPLPFVNEIVDCVRRHQRARDGRGLYVGCGNGRNYVPLVEAGLDLDGLDVSAEALSQLATRCPALRPRLRHGDFRELSPSAPLAYVIALQVFQHGSRAEAATYFARVAEVLAPDGLFFLRVNSASTQVARRHTVVERDAPGGFTVRYEEGPKDGMFIHFFAESELEALTGPCFDTLMAPREDVIPRVAPEQGFWAQWEAIYERR